MVENLKHVRVASNLGFAGRVLVVWRLVWDLLPHLGEIHVNSSIVLDQLLEFLQDRDELLARVVIDVRHSVR